MKWPDLFFPPINLWSLTMPPVETSKGATKYDSGKLRWDLLPWPAIQEVVHVMTFGASKYAPNGWRHVPGAKERYFAALHRHLYAWSEGERIDPESGLLHLAHVATNSVFLLWFELTGLWPKSGEGN